MRKKYIRYETLEVFRSMPVPDSLKERIRQEAERAKALFRQSQQEPKSRPV